MVQEAEKYKAEDDVQRDKVAAKNGLESYAFNMKSTVEDEKLKDKISDEDKQKILDKCNEIISWLDRNQVRVRRIVWACGYEFTVCGVSVKSVIQFCGSTSCKVILLFQSAEKDEFEHQQKELEKVCNPIMTKLYQSAGGAPGGMPGGFPGSGGTPGGGASAGPTIEEVD